jgi:predicted ATPase/class 3 adenylate cyclase/Tfp pilus assembly protein PilF
MPTFLFTDIENSTRLWEKHPDAMGPALARHDAILQAAIEGCGGRILKHMGDGVFAAFEGGEPLSCALRVQQAIAGEDWGEIGELRIRVALHAGLAERRGDDYFGPVVNRTARLLAASWGGQIVFTPEVLAVTDLPAGATRQDLGFHFLKDLGQPQEVYGLGYPALPQRDFPPLRSLAAQPHNLPPQATPFLGREEELAAVARMLEDPACRLITLTGPGGIGKTRLSLQVAAEKIESFAHGVYFVPLAPLSAPEFIISAIADALHFSFYSREAPKVQLLNYLREKALLLVLDNFEHVVAGAGLLAEILQGASQVKLLVSSRERLNLHGEWVYPLGGLAVPSEESAAIEGYSAPALFMQTARRIRPDMALTPGDRPHVVHICQLVEGVPLGIELAASWVRVLSCAEIAQEIAQSADFLATTMRDLPERHRNLRAVFDYSWALLTAREQVVLRRLSVFRGGFRREAAQGLEASLPLLSALVDKSLLRHDAAGRYDILEILRQYAADKLAAVPDEQARARAWHGDFYTVFLHEREEAILGNRQKEVLAEIAAEIENLRAAWTWALEQGRAEAVERALGCLYLFYEMRSWFLEGEEMLGRAAARLRGRPGAGVLLGRLLSRQAWFCERLARYDQALELYQAGLERARTHGVLSEVAFSLSGLGLVTCRQGDYATAQDLLHESLAVCEQIDAPWQKAQALNNLGIVAISRGDFAEARQLGDQVLDIYKQIGYRRGIANTLNNLGGVAGTLGEFVEARRLYEESRDIFREIGDRRGLAFGLNNLGRVLEGLGEYAEAERLCQESLAVFREIGDRWSIANTLSNLGAVACTLGECAPARGYFREAMVTAMALGAVPLVLETLGGMAAILAREGETARAVELAAFVLNHAASDPDTRGRAENLLVEGERTLSPEAFQVAQARGQDREFEEVVGEMRGEDVRRDA